MKEKSRVCVVIVTYNRKEYLIRLLAAIKKQNYFVDGVLIFDNNSTDGTATSLIEMGLTFEKRKNSLSQVEKNGRTYYCFFNNENTGGAGGFHKALRIASELGYEYLWCMDDDVYPQKQCLENLICNMSECVRICVPTRTDTRYKDYAIIDVNMSNPFKYGIGVRKKMISNEKIKGDTIKVVDMPFEGPLIECSLIKDIGLPKKDFFIIFDDSEYAARACKKTDILYCKKAILHKQILLQKSENNLMNWKNYYGYRNQIWFDRHYGKNCLVKFLRPKFLYLDVAFKAIIKKKYSNLNVIKKAYRDGVNDKLGKLVEPGTEGKNV